MKNRDFTVHTYRRLLQALIASGYAFQTFREFLARPAERAVVLRHDVDDRKEHSLHFARIQREQGIPGTYFFRVVPQSFDAHIIQRIEAMGHEIGYHYEDMDFANGDPHQAIRLFEKHLARLRQVAEVTTICMHGSPRSKFDNKDVWKHYDYRDFGILGEPYLDLDFSSVYYLTDTGRRWDGHKVSIRDKVGNPFGLSFRSTHEIIQGLEDRRLPEQLMINFHPQRWTDDPLVWTTEKVTQQIKNAVKFALVALRQRRSGSLVPE